MLTCFPLQDQRGFKLQEKVDSNSNLIASSETVVKVWTGFRQLKVANAS